jgi:glycerophosphoryl diester phosphodiesterase
MNSDRRVLALGVAILATVACAPRQNMQQPPSFSDGGLVARSAAPLNPWALQNVLEGVYNTSSRFGSDVVVHASQWGGVSDGMKASVSILGYDHFAFAILQPGCFTDNSGPTPVVRLVLEGYWRYLDTAEPTDASTGLIRLWVSPQSISDYVCQALPWDPQNPGDHRVPPAVQATLTGATGNGVNTPGDPINVTWTRARKSRLNSAGVKTYYVGVHHGACQTTMNCGISINTPATAVMSTQLGGEYMEIDTRLTKDGVPVFFHLSLSPTEVQGIYCVGKVEDYTYAELLANCRLRNGEIIPRVVDMMSYILTRTSLPMYLDSKTPDTIVPVSQIIAQLQQQIVPCPTGVAPPGKACLYPGSAPIWQRAIIGLPDAQSVTTYQQALAANQLAPNQHCLVEENLSDALNTPCVAWMPRYTRGPMTSDVLTGQQQGLFVGFWTINDPATMDAFMIQASPNGFLTNYLGLANQRFEVVDVQAPPFTPFRVSTP